MKNIGVLVCSLKKQEIKNNEMKHNENSFLSFFFDVHLHPTYTGRCTKRKSSFTEGEGQEGVILEDGILMTSGFL